MEILSLGFRYIFGQNRDTIEVKKENLERSLRLAYEASFFSSTKLYESLRKWEKLHPGFRIFPNHHINVR